ncbi:MAG: hypothetical protein ACK4RF_04150 [Cyclobacteriaceae bacterium]
MRKLLIPIVSLAVVSFTDTEPKLIKTKIAEGMVVSLPKTFRPMDDIDFVQRYPSVRQPIAAFTNEDREVDFSVNLSATQWPDANLELAAKFFKSGIYNLFDGVDMLEEGIKEIHGKEYIYFEFESRIKGDRRDMALQEPVLRYTYIQYLIEPGRTLVFSFNCPRRLRAEWQPTAHSIMKSIRLK